MITIDDRRSTATLAPAAITAGPVAGGLRLVRVTDALARVVARDGAVLGHVESVATADGAAEFAAKRFSAAARAFRPVGDFARLADAIDSLRRQ